MITFKENTFVKGTYDELMKMAKAIEEKGAKVKWDSLSENSNHLWFGTLQKMWEFDSDLTRKCYYELTKSELYEAYEIVDFSILNETDVFLIDLTTTGKWLYQGKDPRISVKHIAICLNSGNKYNDDRSLQYKELYYKSIRVATPQEIEPYKEHFILHTMEKQTKFKVGDTVRCIGDSEITSIGGISAGWEKGKEFVVDRIRHFDDGDVYLPKSGNGVWDEHLELVTTTETRPIQISKETATEWFNSSNETLKQLALTAYPELDEITPKVGDLCLFSDNEELFNLNCGILGIFDGFSRDGYPKEKKRGNYWKYYKKIKTVEFY